MTDLQVALLEWASRQTRCPVGRVVSEITDTDLEAVGWADCLPEPLAELWPKLTFDAQVIAFAFAFCKFRDSDPL